MTTKLNKAPNLTFHKYYELTPDISYFLERCVSLIHLIINREFDFKTSLPILNLKLNKDIHRHLCISEYQSIELTNLKETVHRLIQEVHIENFIQTINTNFIFDLHSSIGFELDELLTGDPGILRKRSSSVRGNKTQSFSNVPGQLKQLCCFANDSSFFNHDDVYARSIINAIITEVYFNLIHPFSDGNGRTARMLGFYIMLKSKMPLFIPHLLTNHYNSNRHTYCDFTVISNNTMNYSSFLLYALSGFYANLYQLSRDLDLRSSVV